LPLTHNDGRPVNSDLFQLTRDELADQFGGASFSSQTIRGVWTHQGRRFEDECRRVFVDIDDTPENRAFFAEYKHLLEERFDQIVIYIRSYPVDII